MDEISGVLFVRCKIELVAVVPEGFKEMHLVLHRKLVSGLHLHPGLQLRVLNLIQLDFQRLRLQF